jgi:hypothetical protein
MGPARREEEAIMTAKKDFKRRVRERQAKTGESYTAARAQVLERADREPPFSVVELVDATNEAHELGFKCDVLVSPGLAGRIPPARVLEHLRDALFATERDPQMEPMRDALLRGVTGRVRKPSPVQWEEIRHFYRRAQAGIGGTNSAGDMLAFHVDGELVIVQLGYVPHMPPIRREQLRVFLTGVEELRVGEGFLQKR